MKKKSTIKYLFEKLPALILICCIGLIGLFFYLAQDLPDPEKLSDYKPAQSTKIYDRTGEILLYDVYREEKRTLVQLSDVSPSLINATLAAEDDSFYDHFGLDLKSTARALKNNVLVWLKLKKTGQASIQGGSTITQQVIKNTLLSREKTIKRKLKEWILAIELEILYPKNKILEIYLNQIPYGNNNYGIESASQAYFKKSAKDLTLAEAALLASLPKAPTYYSPYGSHPDELKERQRYILDRMKKLGYISKEEHQAALNEEIEFAPNVNKIKAPHFIMFVKEYLENTYGVEYVEQEGLKVITTLDWEIQEVAQKAVEKYAAQNRVNHNAQNTAIVVINPKNGQVLAMIGSKDYFDIENDGNVNVAICPRQPGSSFKPFVYAKAFEKGLNPETLVFDLKTEFNPYCHPEAEQEKDPYGLECYHPQNYDERFRGPVSFRQALAQSLNVPSVKVLYLAGIKDTIDLARKMGITTLSKPENYGLALVLGGGEVTLLDETAAFSVFANDGVKNVPSPILKVEDNHGKTLEEFELNPEEIIDPETARTINDILSDNKSRAPVFGEKSYLYFENLEVAAKTGTTQEYRDAWTIGYTPSIAVGVWVGNNDNSKMVKAPGAVTAAPIWHELIKEIVFLNKIPSESFIEPGIKTPLQQTMLNGHFEKIYTIKIDKISGGLATELTPENLIIEKEIREIHNILHYINKENPLLTGNSQNDSQYLNWENTVQKWVNSLESGLNKYLYNTNQPTDYDNVHTQDNKPIIKIISPENGTKIDENQIINLSFSIQSKLGLKKIEYFFDDNFIDEHFPIKTTFKTFTFSFLPPTIKEKNHLITIVAYDEVQNRSQEQIELIIDYLH